MRPPLRGFMGADITVSVPARPDFVHVLRSAVSSVAAYHPVTYDRVDDLRIAVTEACALLLSHRPQARVLQLRISRKDDRLEIVASTDAAAGDWPPAGGKDGLTWKILERLADEVAYGVSDGGPTLRIVEHLPSGRGGT
jgi:serine/threonine-protein kinase RsbW